jgi:hypothetical protein
MGIDHGKKVYPDSGGELPPLSDKGILIGIG